MAISSSQFGEAMPSMDIPLSLSTSTMGSTASATAWRTRGLTGNRPIALSKRTMGTTYRFDDDSTTTLPKSDRGAGRNE